VSPEHSSRIDDDARGCTPLREHRQRRVPRTKDDTVNADPRLPTLRGARVALRAPAPGELDTLAEEMAADPETSPWWSDDAAKIRRWFADPDYNVLVAVEDGRLAGVVGYEEELDPDYRSASVDIALLSCCVGRGLGPDALLLLIDWLITERGHHRVTIDPAVANERAIRAYSKVGFRPIGVAREYERGPDGTWHDNLLMDVLAGDLGLVPSARGSE
jgi:aminoglycoside 6'-N-acetyltransferase